jgi:hypothetical protein
MADRKKAKRNMSEVGYYSVVQYVKNPGRPEAVNVGALLEAEGLIHVEFVDRPQLNGVRDTVGRFERTLRRLIDEGSVADTETSGAEEGLRGLAVRRFPHFAFTEPRPVAVSADPGEVLHTLATGLAATDVTYYTGR